MNKAAHCCWLMRKIRTAVTFKKSYHITNHNFGMSESEQLEHLSINNKSTPWRVKYQGNTIKRFPTKRQAADFYLQLMQSHETAIKSFVEQYTPGTIDLTE